MKCSEIWQIQDLAEAELDEFAKSYSELAAKEKTAENKEWAAVDTARARLKYLTAHAVYMDFLNNVVVE